jgi:hypothetical protein
LYGTPPFFKKNHKKIIYRGGGIKTYKKCMVVDELEIE